MLFRSKKINKVGIKPDVEVNLHPVLTSNFAIIEENAIYKLDSVSEPVATAQLVLEFLKYKIDRTDGYFSQQFETSLKQYQKDHNLKVDGILNKTLYDILLSKTIREWNENTDAYDLQLDKALVIINE